MGDTREHQEIEEEEPEAGPMPPPPGADGEEQEEEADVGPVLPKAKKRKVGAYNAVEMRHQQQVAGCRRCLLLPLPARLPAGRLLLLLPLQS